MSKAQRDLRRNLYAYIRELIDDGYDPYDIIYAIRYELEDLEVLKHSY
jgi:hypothetical protein